MSLTKSKSLWSVYAMHSIDGFAYSLVGVFVPIYFLIHGASLSQIFVYYIVYAIAVLILFYLVGILASRLGLRKTLILRLPFLLLSLWLTYNFFNWHLSLNLVAIVTALQIALYWFPLHLLFIRNSDNEKLGGDVGKLMALPQLLSLPGPLIGAAIVLVYGFAGLFIAAAIFFSLEVLPIWFYAEEKKIEIKLNLVKIVEYARRYKRYFWAQTIITIQNEVWGVILPIIIYLTFKNIFSVAWVSVAAGLSTAIFTFFVGKRINHQNKKRVIRIGTIIAMIVWLARYFTNNEFVYYALSVAAGFVTVLIDLPFNSIFYDLAQNGDPEDFIIFTEIPVALGRLLVYALAVVLVLSLKMIFLFPILVSLYFFIF